MDVHERARALRVDGLSYRQIGEELGVPPRTVANWVSAVAVPAWTRRPNAKDGLRSRAVELRAAGWSVPDIARELSVARSTAWLWVRDRPLDPDGERARAGAERRRAAVRESWAGRIEATDVRRQEVQAEAGERVGAMGDAELLRVGALMYWCEGKKLKPWARRSEQVVFTNSDPGLIRLYLRFLDVAGVPSENIRYRLAIHESADVVATVEWWAAFVGVAPDSFQKTTIKKHNPVTVRHNSGEGYRGCLVVSVLKCRELYWLIEGIVLATLREPGAGDG